MSAGESNEMGQRIPLGFGGLQANARDHVGHFFRITQEWKSGLVPYFKAGLRRGDVCVYVMNPDGHAESVIINSLANEGIDEDRFRSFALRKFVVLLNSLGNVLPAEREAR